MAGAAEVLQEVHVETYGALTKKEKADFILEQVGVGAKGVWAGTHTSHQPFINGSMMYNSRRRQTEHGGPGSAWRRL